VNARASTGPQTAQGRARAARNALRHALSLPVCFNPAFSEEVETLAHEIAGPDANAQTQGLARQVADAQIVCVACGMPAINSYPAHWPSLAIIPYQMRGRSSQSSAACCGKRRYRPQTWWNLSPRGRKARASSR
jgi:hypothetical protein